MSSVHGRHPADEQLLRYADGELAARDADAVRAHLEACWQCRLEVQEIHKVVGECVRYRQDLLDVCPPPAPWADLRPRFSRLDGTLRRPPRRLRLARWAPLAAAAALLLGVWYQWRDTPAVQAAELLRKAALAQEARPRAPRRIEIRTRRLRLTREIGGRPSSGGSAELEPVRALFLAARYSWDDPLSARSYRAWHDQLAGSRDEVVTLDDAYTIRTFADAGVVTQASLTLSRRDYRPLSERLEFRNREWVEISELPEAPPAPAVAAVPVPPRGPRRMAEAPVSATIGDELQVLAALHRVGADLGDPVEVSQRAGRIVVSGVGVDPERRQEIEEALAPLRHVVVRFSDPALSGTPSAATAAASGLPPPPPRLQSRLEAQLGGRNSFDQLASQALETSDSLMARVYALRRLAERFSPAVESELSAADRQVLVTLRREHAAVLSREAVRMQLLLAPVLGPLGAAPAAAPAPGLPASWQAATEDLFHAARRVEVLSAAVFAGTPAGLSDAQLPSSLASALARLRDLSETYLHFGTSR